jgi:hypothetical protein
LSYEEYMEMYYNMWYWLFRENRRTAF